MSPDSVPMSASTSTEALRLRGRRSRSARLARRSWRARRRAPALARCSRAAPAAAAPARAFSPETRPTRCHCERASSRCTAPAERSPAISMRVTWLRSSSGISNVASARVSPASSVKGASPSRWPRAESACSMPARVPPSARRTCASSRAARPRRRRRRRAPRRRRASRPRTARRQPRLAQLLGERARLAVMVDAVGEPHDAGCPAPRSVRGDRLRRRLAVGRERLRLQRRGRRAGGGRRLDPQAVLFRRAGGRHHHDRAALPLGLGDQALDHEACAPASAAAAQPLSTTSTTGPEPVSAFSRFGIEHRLGQRQDHQRGRRHADQRQPPRRLGRRLLAVLDADQDAGRRELDAPRARRDGAQQPLDDRQRQQRPEQPRTEEGERTERHGRALRRVPALPASSGSRRHALQAHDERQQRLRRGPVGVMHQERPAEPARQLLDPGAMRGEPLR